MEHEGVVDINCNWRARDGPEGLERELEKLELRDHPGYSIVEIGQNTERSLGELRRFAITQTPVKDHHLTLVVR